MRFCARTSKPRTRAQMLACGELGPLLADLVQALGGEQLPGEQVLAA